MLSLRRIEDPSGEAVLMHYGCLLGSHLFSTVTVREDDSVVSALARVGWEAETVPGGEGSRAHALAAPSTAGTGAATGATVCSECGVV